MESMAKTYKSHRANPVKPAQAGSAAKQKASKKPGQAAESERPKEIGGPSGPEPTRYGDWEIGGRCVDF